MSLPAQIRVIERGWLSSNNIVCFEGGNATLVDSGYVGHAAQTVELVKSAVVERLLTRLINTHSHSDHIGGNAALQRAFGRLEAFERDPKRVARNAVKACLTFSLLDLGRLPQAGLAAYLQSVPLFRNVGRDHLAMTPAELADWLRADLLRAVAIALDGDDIVPTMAA